MRISKIEELILKNASSININRGNDLINQNKLLKLNIHKVNDCYNIYGNFKSENKLQSYSAHLVVDIKKEDITKCSCNCEVYEEGINNNKVYYCEHIVAAGLKYVNAVKEKMKQKKIQENKKINILDKLVEELKEEDELDTKKEKLELNLSIRGLNEKNNEFFDLSLFINRGTASLPVLNIEECIDAFIHNNKYIIGKGLVYDSDKYYFCRDDEKIISIIYEYILISPKSFNKNVLRIPSYSIHRIIKYMNNRKIKFNYNYINNICTIKNEDIPLTFSLKKSSNKYLLTTKKVLPISLNEEKTVYLYDRTIYLPSEKQNKIYKILHEEFKNNKMIIFDESNSNDNLFEIIKVIQSISDNIFYDEEILNIVQNDIKPYFNFVEEDNKFFCDVYLRTKISNVNYSCGVKNDNIFAPKRKLLEIESLLNKNRFYYKNDRFQYLGDDDEYYQFLKYGIKTIEEYCSVDINSKSFEFKKFKIEDINLKKKDYDKYDLKMSFDDISKSDLENAIKSYKEDKTYIKLQDGSYVDLTSNEFKLLMQLMENLNITSENYKDEFEVELNKLFYLNNKLENGDLINSVTVHNKLKDLLDSDIKQVEFEVSKNLHGKLRKYQEEGFNWFKNLKRMNLGGILCDEMGLGKTIQTISFLLSDIEEKQNLSMIIVPTSLIYNWKEEFNKFAPSLRIGIIHGKEKSNIENVQEYDVLLTTYGMTRNNFDIFEDIKFENIFLDEGQNINNPKAQITNIAKKLKSNNRFVLTGTPIENNLIELWSIFDFIMPGYLYSLEEFKQRFVNSDNISELKILISPYILRREKSDVLIELPEKREKTYFIKNTESQNNIYNGFVQEIKKNINNEKNNIVIFSYLTKLRQICLDPSLILEDYNGGSGKLDFLREYLNNNNDSHKILVFSQFTSVLKKIEEFLKEDKLKFLYLDGSVNSKKRLEMVDEFNNTDDAKIFLISLKAGGTGLNLTSADTVIVFDPWWNMSSENQAADRAHRIGQKNNVSVLKLIAKDTIEEKILSMQEDKTELINSIITNDLKENNVINKLNKDELLKLI